MKKILVVDDELSIVNFLSDVVRVLGYESKFLTSGKKVIPTVKEWKPDLITLDIMIPPPNGVEILTQLKADPKTASIPVYIISAVTSTPDVKAILHLAQAVFTKPLDTKDFITQLRSHLDKVPS